MLHLLFGAINYELTTWHYKPQVTNFWNMGGGAPSCFVYGCTTYGGTFCKLITFCSAVNKKWLFLDDIAAKTGFMVTEKGERAFQGTFYAARFLLNEQDF